MGNIIILVIEVSREAQFVAIDQAQGDVRRLHESEPDLDPVEAAAETVNRTRLTDRAATGTTVVGDVAERRTCSKEPSPNERKPSAA